MIDNICCDRNLARCSNMSFHMKPSAYSVLVLIWKYLVLLMGIMAFFCIMSIVEFLCVLLSSFVLLSHIVQLDYVSRYSPKA